MLTTLSRAKPFLQLQQSDSSQDNELRMAILAASQAIENECRRSFKLQNYVQTLSGDGSPYISLRNSPVVSIVEIIESDGGSIVDYRNLGDGLVLRAARWPYGQHNITVTYEGGYILPVDETGERPHTLPEPLELACIMLAQMIFEGNYGKESERTADYAVTFQKALPGRESNLPPAVAALVSPYVWSGV
ncbi:phage gp6-like head-tail connector protein [Paenibacillus sp. MBLB4367]|uniref:phage gp6-like head-tail connector protein n=1 Tax=Paenibacillus sp. MBLB4367 TaxID=3384767 RepID=UPI003907F9E5